MYFLQPALIKLAFKNEFGGISFIRCVVICGLSSFMFGYHVHEKAILTAIIALRWLFSYRFTFLQFNEFLIQFSSFSSVLSVINKNDARVFIILSLTGSAGLFPLLYPKDLLLLKLLFFTFYAICTSTLLIQRFKKNILFLHEWLYIAGLPLIIVYESVLHEFLFNKNLPFLPLAITSLYCSLGVTYSFFLYYFMYYFEYK